MAITQAQVDQLYDLLVTKHDRAGFYLAYFEMIRQPVESGSNWTGAVQVLMQAHIGTYSGIMGGSALTGNAIAQLLKPDVYNVDLDTFSHIVATGLFNGIVADLGNTEKPEELRGVLSANEIQDIDKRVWTDMGLIEFFPGNPQRWD